jgi:hypothetical protein
MSSITEAHRRAAKLSRRVRLFWPIAIFVLALSVPASARQAPQNQESPAVTETLAPALMTSSITLDKDKGPFTIDWCRTYAINVMGKMKAEHLELAGSNTVFGIASANGRLYSIGVRCEIDNFLISIVVAGPNQSDAAALMKYLNETWFGK